MDELPPLAAIRVFDAVARRMSFTAAAGDLGMTQAGVSYQIRLLEDRLGAALFLRKPRGIELTALGARLARPTHEAFDTLRGAFGPQSETETLSISALPTMAGNWLSQRLGRFQIENPGLAVRLDSSAHLVDFAREDMDVAIRCGAGDWPGLIAHRLFEVDFAPMLSPAMAAAHGPFTDPAQIMPLPWVSPRDPTWDLWLAAAGIERNCEPCAARTALELNVQLHEARARRWRARGWRCSPRGSSASSWPPGRWSSRSRRWAPTAGRISSSIPRHGGTARRSAPCAGS